MRVKLGDIDAHISVQCQENYPGNEKVKTVNPLILFDEIDKMGHGF